MLILQKLGGLATPPIPPLATALASVVETKTGLIVRIYQIVLLMWQIVLFYLYDIEHSSSFCESKHTSITCLLLYVFFKVIHIIGVYGAYIVFWEQQEYFCILLSL
jgi:hypothetical protein